MLLTKIILQNFKQHKNSQLQLKKINILIGPNGAGKSSFLQALLILKKSLNGMVNSLITQDPSFNFGKYEDIVRSGNLEYLLGIGISGQVRLSHGLSHSEPTYAKFRYDISLQNRRVSTIKFTTTIGRYNLYLTNDDGIYYNFLTSGPTQKEIPLDRPSIDNLNPRFSLRPYEQLSDVERQMYGFATKDEVNFFSNNFHRLFQNGEFTRTILNDFYYVPFLRTLSSYSVQFFDSDEFVFDQPEKTSSALLSKISSDSKLRRDVSNLVSILFGKTIEHRNLALPTDREKPTVTLDVVKNNFASALINEGTGLNQIILLLATLTKAPPNSVIGIEEPEIHLHPKAQSKLAKIIIDISQKQSKQIILTTHSEHMLYPFLASVASKSDNSLSYEDLAIFYVDIDEKEQTSIVESLEINEKGQIKGGLKGFWDADMDAFSEFLGETND